MDVRKMRNELLGKRLVAALESRNMEAYYVETKEEAVKKALELIPKGSSINMGGATSVKECGLYEAQSMEYRRRFQLYYLNISFMTGTRCLRRRKSRR